MAGNFIDSRVFNQRALHHTGVKTVAHLEAFDLGGKLFDKLVVDAILHINTVGAHAGLTSIAVLAGHGPFNR